ncbi:hypothetical protein FDENT_8913 [Fusarium denticulatum]|uniref:Oxidoreductase acuF-like C2H2 type zinc-finger domain-containing protein n=1 Tax=Fusarium denticulatum TaxID=48507 RepID=A0A8H5TUD4_9HYPO|nr:hypothetical protein FDENT_8913 [Fusarium denticulatum]
MSVSLGRETDAYLPTASISKCALKCFESFQHCLNSASKSDKPNATWPKSSLVRVEDQLARFQLWTASIRVFSTGRDSLDYRLRDALDVKTPIIGLLQALDFRIKTGSQILDSMNLNLKRKSIEEPIEEFVQTLGAVSSEITLLHKITNTIRRASKDTQNSRAAERYKIIDEEGNDVGPFIQSVFLNYINDRYSVASEEIRQRLASSMVLRRKRLLYRQERYGKNPIHLPQKASGPNMLHPKSEVMTTLGDAERPSKRRIIAAPSHSAMHSAETATTFSPEGYKKAAAPSVLSVSKTVPLSDEDELVFPPAPSDAFEQRYNKAKQDIEDRHKQRLSTIDSYYEGVDMTTLAPGDVRAIIDAGAVRDRALVKARDDCLKAVSEVTCPYCFHMLPIHEVVDELKWKYHVKNDLEPYVCLFEACHISEHLYTDSSTWINHMSQHTLRWRCASKRHGEFVADTRDQYLDHMKHSHPGMFTDDQLGILADQNARKTGPLFRACPLCGEEKPHPSLIDHLVGHMRFLALKSLPPHQEDTGDWRETDEEQDKWSSTRPSSRSTIENASVDDFTFSFTGAPDRLPEGLFTFGH